MAVTDLVGAPGAAGRDPPPPDLVERIRRGVIGEDTVLAGQVGIAGSTKLGRGVTLAGQVGVGGHLTIGDGVTATGQTGITSDVPAGALVSGCPVIENRTWRKASAIFAKLPELLKRLRELERKVEERAAPK